MLAALRCSRAAPALARPLAALPDGFRFSAEQVVPWGSMDAMRHLSHVEMVRFFESARVQYFGRIGMGDFEPSECAPILAGLTMTYKGPVAFPDTLTIGVRTARAEGSELEQEYAAVSEGSGRVVATGTCRIVMIDYTTGQRVGVPEEVMAAISAIEG